MKNDLNANYTTSQRCANLDPCLYFQTCLMDVHEAITPCCQDGSMLIFPSITPSEKDESSPFDICRIRCCYSLIAPSFICLTIPLNAFFFGFFVLICRIIQYFVLHWFVSWVSSVEAFCHHQLVMLDSCTHQSTDSLWLTDYELHSLTFGQLHSLWRFIVAELNFCRRMWSANLILLFLSLHICR